MNIVDPHVHLWTHDPAYPWAPETTHPPPDEMSFLTETDRQWVLGRTALKLWPFAALEPRA